MLIINTARMGDNEERLKGDIPGSILELDDVEDIKAEGPVRYDLKASLVSGNLMVRGLLEAEVSFSCFRCGVTYKETLRDRDFIRMIKLSGKDECVNLTEDVRESIILTFPTKPLCNSGCKGLCSRCGKNLNKGKCRCVPVKVESPWIGLDNLKLGQSQGEEHGRTKTEKVEE